MQGFSPNLNIRLIRQCPICQQSYDQALVQVISENEFNILTYATCGSCGANLLTKFSSLPPTSRGEQGVVGNAFLTDLRLPEVMDFAGNRQLSANDVLAIHQFIAKQELFKKLRSNIGL